MKKTLLILGIIALVFAGCKKFDEIEASKVEIIEETIESGWDYIKINVEYDYPVELEAVTLYLSEKEDMSGAEKYKCDIEGKTFSVEVYDLKDVTKYYYQFEYDNGYGKSTVYGEEKSFNTLINGHDWVDLGLPSGLKWATCNVGASSPEEYGNYYAWGETEPAPGNNYSGANCEADGLSISELQSQGIIDGDHNLTPSHDAATADWGGIWRMPTEAEQQELLNNCTWEWTVQGGKNGCKVTGPNGNNIFLPAAGLRNGSSLYYAGERGHYRSSSPDESDSSYACYLYFKSSFQNVSWSYRHFGRSVRPVAE